MTPTEKLAVAVEALRDAAYALYMERKRCQCWAKMSGACPTHVRHAEIEQRCSELVATLAAPSPADLCEHARAPAAGGECPDCDAKVPPSPEKAETTGEAVREALTAAAMQLYTERKRCACWAKMSGACPQCVKRGEIENQCSAALTARTGGKVGGAE
jgi:hypothetical protein